MMMSPESYYEFYIKGKSQEEISKEIKSLKRELRQLIKKTEQNLFMPEELTHPNSQVRIKYNREYLDLAITAYEQAGGTYKRSKSELNSLKFDQDLNSMNKLIFTIGGFFGGYETRTFSISGDNVMLEIAHSLTGTLLKPLPNVLLQKTALSKNLKRYISVNGAKNIVIQTSWTVHSGILKFILTEKRKQLLFPAVMHIPIILTI